ncbi:MAG TPA: MdtA/MuxA family multidrug efflux RND transporter periplasmic adaptor subunit [Steroidobacteraceae bacterium]|jgi:multidrug efflux system membrane fusion protein|nr:MdtA/MuxA family multidrug efflux RND transporter periplasmic adaptor subunit [Steroidobacteraceae bacterium]
MNDDDRSYSAPADAVGAKTPSRWHRLFAGRPLLRIVVVLVALALLAWLLTPKGTKAPSGRAGAGGPMPVVGVAAQSGDMPIVLNGLGAVTPIATVTVQSQIAGQIIQIAFKEGQTVNPGDPLLQIDPRPYEVALEQAQGALVRDKALLANARVDLVRYQTLFAEDSIAEQQLATQRALVVQDEGTVKTDQGQIDAAKLNLVYCHIVSPVAGRVGLQQITLGNYVTPAEPNGLVVVTQLQPITVVFTLPEDQIPALQTQLHAGKTLAVSAYDRSRATQLATGTLQTVDNQIDPTTGTVKLKAIFANDGETLFPNQFVNVSLLLTTLHNATLIPQAGVQRGAPGTYVYVIDAQQTVSVRKVTLGPGDPTNVVITQGLKPGEMVVVDGADKLKDGAKVLQRQSPAPAAASAAPPPAAAQRHRKSAPSAPADHGTQPAAQ